MFSLSSWHRILCMDCSAPGSWSLCSAWIVFGSAHLCHSSPHNLCFPASGVFQWVSSSHQMWRWASLIEHFRWDIQGNSLRVLQEPQHRNSESTLSNSRIHMTMKIKPWRTLLTSNVSALKCCPEFCRESVAISVQPLFAILSLKQRSRTQFPHLFAAGRRSAWCLFTNVS